MPGPAVIFREIHRLRSHAKDLQNRLEQGPRQLKAQQANVAKREEELREDQEALKQLKVSMHQDEVSLKATQQQIAKYQKQLNESTVKKEYDALKVEIEHGHKEVARREDAILTAMGDIEERTGQLPPREKAVQEAQAAFAEFERDRAARLASLTEQHRQVLDQITAVEVTLPEATREQYDRLLRLRGDDAMAPVAGQSCVACYTEITAQSYNDLRMELFVVCKNCGRFLYLPE